MPDPVLYLTDDTTAAVAALTGQTEAIDPVTLIGQFKSHEPYRIVLATSMSAIDNIKGRFYDRVEIIGSRLAIHPHVLEYANKLVREPQ